MPFATFPELRIAAAVGGEGPRASVRAAHFVRIRSITTSKSPLARLQPFVKISTSHESCIDRKK
jgi:hypothetical protein